MHKMFVAAATVLLSATAFGQIIIPNPIQPINPQPLPNPQPYPSPYPPVLGGDISCWGEGGYQVHVTGGGYDSPYQVTLVSGGYYGRTLTFAGFPTPMGYGQFALTLKRGREFGKLQLNNGFGGGYSAGFLLFRDIDVELYNCQMGGGYGPYGDSAAPAP